MSDAARGETAGVRSTDRRPAGRSDLSAPLAKIAGLLLSRRRVAILIHNSTDGDTLGSGLAAALALEKLGKDVALIHEEGFPDHLSVLPTQKDFFLFARSEEQLAGMRFDIALVFDTADPKLLGMRARLLGQADTVINIDHHVTNLRYGDINLVDSGAAATAEVAYYLIGALGVELDAEMALAIYTGICTDTGGFSFGNTTGRSHEIAAKTLAYGIDVAHLRYKFFDAITPAKLKCHGFVANAIELHEEGRVALAIVSAAELAAMGAAESDCDGLVNIGRNIVGVHVSAFAREVKPGEFRVNLRSRGGRDVAAVAAKFKGGGHRSAAGCTIRAPSGEIGRILLNAIKAVISGQ